MATESIAMAPPEYFDANTKAFLAWFTALPGASFSDSIQIVDLRPKHAGRGIGTLSHDGGF